VKKSISKQSAIVSFRSLVNESDKGCVLIIASILEEMLRQLHEAHIATITYPSRENKLFDSLSRTTFGHRIEMAYAYGLISKEDYQDAEIIRELRNEAAHSIFDFSLTDVGVRSVVMKLKTALRNSRSASFLESGMPNDLPAPKHHLILNGLVLNEVMRLKIVSALEDLINKRKEGHK